MKPEFYIGYQSFAPPSLGTLMRKTAAGLALMMGAGMLLAAALQQKTEPGLFEFGVVKPFEGTLVENPIPMLRSTTGGGSTNQYLLVAAGKHGLPPFAKGRGMRRVRFNGTLIQKGETRMIEMNDPASFTDLGPAEAGDIASPLEMLGKVVLTGELIDTKCHLGVMRPSEGKIHRACAVRCLEGGVPPGLLVHDSKGRAAVVLLAGVGGGTLKFNPQWAGRVLRVEGSLRWRDGSACVETAQLQLLH